jgi:hypothetical protein
MDRIVSSSLKGSGVSQEDDPAGRERKAVQLYAVAMKDAGIFLAP